MRIKRSLLFGFVAILLVASVFGTVIGTGVNVEDESSLSGGSVAEEDAVEIEDWHDLDGVRDDLDGDYVLMDDLDETTDGYDELVDTEEGWEPIAPSDEKEETSFKGTFDGQNYTISNIYTDREGKRGGGSLFGDVGDESVIKNLGIEDADMNGGAVSGILVADMWGGTVKNCYTEGEINSENNFIGGLVGQLRDDESRVYSSSSTAIVNGNERVGGLVGNNYIGTVENSFATGNLSGGSRAGGLVGYNSGMVENSYAMGDVRDGLLAGGLVGYNHGGTVENSYATGDVSGNSPIGGLVGTNSGKIENSYSTGEVRKGLLVYNNGGLVGLNDDGEVSDSYWDTDTSGLDESDGGTGLTTDKMTGEEALNNMDSFDFEEIWETVEEDHEDAEKDGYPILQELSREEQLQHAYPADPAEDDGIPGFTSTLLLLAAVIAVAIYKKKKW